MYTGLERRHTRRRDGDRHPSEFVHMREGGATVASVMVNRPKYPCYESTEASDNLAKQNGIDPFKPLLNVRGDEVILLTTNAPGACPLIGFVLRPEAKKNWHHGVLHRWTADGRSYDGATQIKTKTRLMDLVQNHEEPFDVTEPLQTRGGDSVRILTTNRMGERSIVGLVRKPGTHYENYRVWYPNGRKNQTCKSAEDLVNVRD